MIYYRVKADLDNYPKYTYIGNSTKVKKNGILIGHELYTPAERKKIANSDAHFEKVVVSARKTYWFFGSRFEYLKGPATYEG